MSLLDARFKVTGVRDCPLYEIDDEFRLLGLGLRPPEGKPACLFLARVISKHVVEDLGPEPLELNCTGCTGLIKFAVMAPEEAKEKPRLVAAVPAKREGSSKQLGALTDLLSNVSLFHACAEDNLKGIISCLTMEEFHSEETILEWGHPGKDLYIVVEGRVAVLDAAGGTMATLGKGDIFGEMSLLSGRPISATIKAVGLVKVLRMGRRDLGHVLIKYPFLHMSFTRLLVQRLTQANAVRADEFATGMVGQLRDIPSPELFQLFHENMKSGFFELVLPGGPASVLLIDGEIVTVRYLGMEGAEAFFAILREKDGRFRFTPCLCLEEMDVKSIGSFMKLLMEGMRRIDEESQTARQTHESRHR